MKIPVGVIIKQTASYSNNRDDVVYSEILEDKDFIILCLIVLYHTEKISHKQFTLYCQRYFNTDKKTMLNRRIKTCHSVFDGKWYDDISFLSVIAHGMNQYSIPYDMSMEDVLKYLNIGFSKNKNWCVNYVALSWIKPIIHKAFSWDNLACQQIIKEFNIPVDFMTFEEADRKYDLDSGYCCSDCDGCRGEYKRSRYESSYKPNKSKIFDTFREELIKYQSHSKNPNNALLNNFR